MRSTVSILVAALTTLVVVTTATAADTANTKVGKQIADFTIPDCYGKSVSLSDFKDSKLVVVAFLGTDCPLVRLYGPRLDQLAKKYADSGIALIGINSNRQDQPRKIAAHARQHGMTFPILTDL